MKRQTIITLLVLIGGFFIPAFSAKADPVTLYEQGEDNTIVRELETGTAYYKIGTFTPTATTYIPYGTIVYWGVALRSDFNPSTSGQLFIASTTNATEGSLSSTTGCPASPQIESTSASVDFITATSTSGSCTLIGGHTYGIYQGNGSGFYNGDIKIRTNADQTQYYGYITTEIENTAFGDNNVTTRFISSAFDPYDEDVVATGTPVSLTGFLYINQQDMDGEILTDGWWIEARIRRDSDNQVAVANITLLDTTLRIDDDWVATYNSFSTSTEFEREGRYTIQWTLHRPSVWNSLSSFFGLEAYFNAGVLAEYTTHVVAGELTSYDEYVNSFQEGVENSFASTTLAVLTDRLATCNPLGNFSMLDCLAGLFTLDPQSSTAVVDQFRSLIATKAPLGYVTRLIDIATSQTATTSLPSISLTFPAGLPLVGKTLDFDFNQILSDASEIASSTLVSSANPNENIWTIAMPLINTILYLLLFFLIINDITGMYRTKAHR